MAFRDVSRIPLPPFGSAMYGTLSVTRDRIALSAVGSGQMGSYSLNKAIGTLNNVDIGSSRGNYGSYGTAAGRLATYGYGSYTGTTRAPLMRGARGSYGTAYGAQARFRYGSFTRLAGSLAVTRTWGSLPTSRVGPGTLTRPAAGAAYGSYGTLAGPFARLSHGSIGTVRSPRVLANYGSHGTAAARWSRAAYGSHGTQAGALTRSARGSFGTATSQVAQGRYGSYSGTVVAILVRASHGSFGTARGAKSRFFYGSHGTSAGQHTRGRYGSYTGTVRAPLMRGGQGSFGTSAGQVARGRYGSYTGTVRAPLMRGGQGSYGTSVGQLTQGRYGSYTGTLRAPIVRGNRGSFGQPLAFTLGTLSGQIGAGNGSNRNPRAAGARYRFVTVWAPLGNPNPPNAYFLRITQTRGQNNGTLAYTERAQTTGVAVGSWALSVSAFIDPHAGSWRAGTGIYVPSSKGTAMLTSWFF